MNSFKAFFNRITQCAIDPLSYKELRKTKLRSAYWYLYELLFLTSLVTILWIGAGLVHAMPYIKKVATDIEQRLPSLYPKELVLRIESGALTTNVKEPYVIHVPTEWRGYFGSGSMYPLAIIDTKASVEDYDPAKGFFLFTKKMLVAGKDNGEIRMVPYSKFNPNIVITHQLYQTMLQKFLAGIKNFLPTLKTILVAGFALAPFPFAGIALLWWMFALLFSSLLLFFFSSIAKWGFTYGEVYKLSVYGTTPILLLGMLLSLFGIIIPGMLQILFFIWMAYVLSRIR